MENNESVPKIRFVGFTEAWEQRKLGETLRDLKSGLSRMLSNDDIGLPVVRANNIYDGQFDMKNDVKYWYENDPQGAKTDNYLVHQNDILINFINSEAKMGTATIVQNEPNRKTIYTTNILKAQVADDFDNYFWFSLTQTYRYKNDIKIITKPAVNQASFTTVDFKKLCYQFPIYSEQKKIGTLFHNLDNLITFHQRKCDETTTLKKYMLKKMFPQNGAEYPEIRFGGFTEAWEQRKLGDVLNVCSGRDYKHLDYGDIPVYGTGGYMLSVSEALSENRDAIGIGRKGTIDKPFVLKSPFWTVDTLFYCIPRTNVDLSFSFSIFQNINWKAMDESTGVPSLSKSAINKVEILLPKLTEQIKIGQYFDGLDNLITFHQRKRDELTEIKNYMLKNMFPQKG